MIGEADYFALGADVRAEIVGGQVVRLRPHTLRESVCGQTAAAFVGMFAAAHDSGHVVGSGAFKLEAGPQDELQTVRVPDAAYISFKRLPRDASLHIFPDFAPDLAIEVISDTESFSDVLKKTHDFLDHGTEQVWLILPDLREIRVLTPGNRAGAVFTEDDTLTGGDLLPGFSVPVQAIFDTGNTTLHLEVLRRLLG